MSSPTKNQVVEETGLAIGLMSGTSGDGIDAALVRFKERSANQGVDRQFPAMELIASQYTPYSETEREQVFALFRPDVSARYVVQMDARMGRWFGNAAMALMKQAGVSAQEVSVIGSHGQTVYHAPSEFATLQIGQAAMIVEQTGCAVVSDFRTSDVALGGQGAPLVPYFDYGYFSSNAKTRVVLNIGGISNITVLSKGSTMDRVIAFDTGPGNMLIDALVRKLSQDTLPFDRGGQLAAQGTPMAAIVEKWLREDEYLHRVGPKSTGRERYGVEFLSSYQADMAGMSIVDQVATLTQFVARTIAMGIRMAVRDVFELIVSGGGSHNQVLMHWIKLYAAPDQVLLPDEFGIPSDMKEAMAFALFGWQFIHQRPTNLPSVTGASRPTVLGRWTPRPT